MSTAAEEWVKAARDDLETVKELLSNPRLTQVVAFHTQQCIEKCFKAVLEHHKRDLPKIHNLVTLHGRVQKYLERTSVEIDVDMLDRLNELYIDARYPGERGLLPEGKPSIEEAQQFSHFADHVLRVTAHYVRDESE